MQTTDATQPKIKNLSHNDFKNNLLNKIKKHTNIKEFEEKKIANSTATLMTIKKYQRTLNKLRKLEKKLIKLENFDSFVNSRSFWEYSVNKFTKSMDKIKLNIDGEIILAERISRNAIDGDPSYSYSIFAFYY